MNVSMVWEQGFCLEKWLLSSLFLRFEHETAAENAIETSEINHCVPMTNISDIDIQKFD